MGKKKSAICLVLITLIIAVLIGVCFVSFPCGELNYFNSLLSLTEKDADLGGYLIGDTAYLGGGFEMVYYPDGVISSKEYEETVAYKEGDELEEYQNSYLKHGAVYLERETVLKEGTDEVSDTFKAGLEKNVSVLNKRFEQLHAAGTSVQVAEDYTVRVFLPATLNAAAVAFQYYSYTGDFTLKYGDSAEKADVVIPAQKGEKHSSDYYVKGASAMSSGGNYMVAIEFTDEGKQIISDTTSEGNKTLYFYVGENLVFNLSVSEQYNQKTLYVTGNYTSETSTIVAALIDSSLQSGESGDLAMTPSDVVTRTYAGYGDGALKFLYIALGALIGAMLVYFFVRYRRLGFTHLYSYLTFALLMVVCIWAIPTVSIGIGTAIAFALTSVLLAVSNIVSYECAKKEYASGKALTYSIKSGYGKCTWGLFDLHIVLLIISLFTYFIAFTQLQMFALVFALGTVFSGLCSLILNRFYWYIMLPFAKRKDKFCHFTRSEEAEEDE